MARQILEASFEASAQQGPPELRIELAHLRALAADQSEDRIAWLAAKSAGRAAFKYEVTRQLGNNYGDWGFLVGTLFTLATEHADLRSWSTLPDSWQAARLFLRPGEHTLVLRALGGEQHELGRFALEPGETMFVFARSVGPHLYAHTVGGRLLEQQTPAVWA